MRDKNKVMNYLAKLEKLERTKKLYTRFKYCLDIINEFGFKLFEEDIGNIVDNVIKIIDRNYKNICITFNKRYDRKTKKWNKRNMLDFVNSIINTFLGIKITQIKQKSNIYINLST